MDQDLVQKFYFCSCSAIKTMKITRANGSIQLTINEGINQNGLERLIRFVQHLEATMASEASQKDIDQIASESKKEWWETNRHRFGL